jgi:hypothetical protein
MVTAESGRRTPIRPRRPRALLLATLLLGFLVHPLAQPARAATVFGHDISWPQCPSAAGGYGLPMPPDSTGFVILGLTRGLAFTENPCLADQVGWVRDHGTPSHAYAMGTFPTESQLAAHGGHGPWETSTRSGQLRNVGYAAAEFAVASMDRLGWRPPMVWIDVEPRRAQPWPTGSATREEENRFVLEGLMRGLQDHGFAHGLYSYAAGWHEITGDWRLPTVPVWATAGRLDHPDEALDRCSPPSFSGGPVYIAQWYDDTRDYDRTCSEFSF